MKSISLCVYRWWCRSTQRTESSIVGHDFILRGRPNTIGYHREKGGNGEEERNQRAPSSLVLKEKKEAMGTVIKERCTSWATTVGYLSSNLDGWPWSADPPTAYRSKECRKIEDSFFVHTCGCCLLVSTVLISCTMSMGGMQRHPRLLLSSTGRE